MPTVSIFDKTYKILEQTLDISQKRHSLISSNVANVDTPGYRSKDIPFDETLKKQIERMTIDPVRTDSRHFGNILPDKNDFEISEERNTGVDIDREMSRLAENNIRYQTGVEILLKKFNGIKNAITEGGR